MSTLPKRIASTTHLNGHNVLQLLEANRTLPRRVQFLLVDVTDLSPELLVIHSILIEGERYSSMARCELNTVKTMIQDTHSQVCLDR
jgi:hypothetical protein